MGAMQGCWRLNSSRQTAQGVSFRYRCMLQTAEHKEIRMGLRVCESVTAPPGPQRENPSFILTGVLESYLGLMWWCLQIFT